MYSDCSKAGEVEGVVVVEEQFELVLNFLITLVKPMSQTVALLHQCTCLSHARAFNSTLDNYAMTQLHSGQQHRAMTDADVYCTWRMTTSSNAGSSSKRSCLCHSKWVVKAQPQVLNPSTMSLKAERAADQVLIQHVMLFKSPIN